MESSSIFIGQNLNVIINLYECHYRRNETNNDSKNSTNSTDDEEACHHEQASRRVDAIEDRRRRVIPKYDRMPRFHYVAEDGKEHYSTYDDLVTGVHDRIASLKGGTIKNIRTIESYMEEFERACSQIRSEEKSKTRKESKSKSFFRAIKNKITGTWDKVFGKTDREVK